MKTLVSFLILLISTQAGAFVPREAFTFDFNIKTIRMSDKKQDKIIEAVELLKRVFSSPEFKEKILSHKFRGKFQFFQSKNLSNRQIYHRILAGVERLHPFMNNAMDVEIELYSDFNSRVLGFTRPSSRRIWMNRKYFNKHSPAELAAHLTHEWLHKLGFDHDRERTRNRKYSVPYAVGYIVRDIAKNEFKIND